MREPEMTEMERINQQMLAMMDLFEGIFDDAQFSPHRDWEYHWEKFKELRQWILYGEKPWKPA